MYYYRIRIPLKSSINLIQRRCENNIKELIMFLKTYKPTDNDIFRQKVKNFDAPVLPNRGFESTYLLRTVYISKIWNNAHLKLLTTLSTLNCGRSVNEDGIYCFNWLTDQLPPFLGRFINHNGDLNFDNEDKEDDSNENEQDDEEFNDGSMNIKKCMNASCGILLY
ncbi:hypothetical protein ABEB36_010596 [Hypothenemus hampei]|uniref:Uncharacterized protein n=1 Tax=Hypothenemus hampei TaxID=57062 RepID=A0ABD1ECQ9_HYPHA